MGGLKATTTLFFIGHFVVRPPCEKVQGPLQLGQAMAFCSENTGAHGGFFKTGTPAFCSESIG